MLFPATSTGVASSVQASSRGADVPYAGGETLPSAWGWTPGLRHVVSDLARKLTRDAEA